MKAKEDFAMDAYDVIHEISRKKKVPMRRVSGEIGVSPQAFYKSLHGNIGLWRFKEIVEVIGYRVAIVDEEGEVVKRL